MSATGRVAIAVLGLALGGCALLSKSHSVELRYFTAEPAPPAIVAAAPSGLRLRLGRIAAAAYLKDRIAFRAAPSEIGYYGTLRWAEPPDAYLRRAMARALFAARPLQEIVSGGGPELELDLEAFEELRVPRHAARVTLTWRLRDDRAVVRQATVVIDVPIAEGDGRALGNAVAAAMATALGDAVERVVVDVVATMARPAPSDQAASAAP